MRSLVQWICALALCGQALFAASLFGDRVVAKGKGIEVKYSEVEEAFISYRANQAAANLPVPDTAAQVKAAEAEILDHLINTKVLLAHATEADKTNATAFAEKFIKDKKSRAGSEASFKRQMLAVGVSVDQFEQQVREQAIARTVIERELRPKQNVTGAEMEQYYKDNPKLFQEPEKWKVSHIHFWSRDPKTLEELSADEQKKKEIRMTELALRARGGEDFGKLVKEYSADMLTRDEGGIYTFARGQLPPEFEAAATTMKPGQISDPVRTRYGWHVIKLIEIIPPKTADFASSKDKIKESILQEKTQKALPDFVQKLRKDLSVELIP